MELLLNEAIYRKVIVIDGQQAFVDSANLTGAGLGAKGVNKRNFEAGFLTEDSGHVRELMDWIDQLYLGEFCLECRRRSVCPNPIAQMKKTPKLVLHHLVSITSAPGSSTSGCITVANATRKDASLDQPFAGGFLPHRS